MEKAPASSPGPVAELLPPPDPRAVYRVAGVGLGLSAAAALLGAVAAAAWGDTPAVWDGLPESGDTPWLLHTVRLVLVGFGALLAGAAVSMRPGLWRAWALAAGTGLLAAVIGLPDHWDSFRLLAWVLTGLAAVGAVLVALPPLYRYSLASLAVLFHFGGILTATTWPEPTPWITNQMAERVYMPYLSFVYMRNAYHFYSPEPGPASILCVLVKYDEIDPATKKPVAQWVILPQRAEHMKDPLGLTYYRRLSLTEMISGTIPGLFSAESFEKLDARQRRLAIASGVGGKEPIPLAPPEFEPEYNQYKVPRPDVSRYLLPAYARHLAVEYAAPGRKVTGVRIYRLEHRIVTTQAFVRGTEPYSPIGYRPYYLGEYTPDGELVDPQDPMLYWLVPILPRPGGASPNDPEHRDYIDYLSKHAGYELQWRRP